MSLSKERTQEYIEKVRAKYTDKYEVLSDFKDNYNKVRILCKETGKFFDVDPKFFISDKYSEVDEIKNAVIDDIKIELNKSLNKFFKLNIKHKESGFEFVAFNESKLEHKDFQIEYEEISINEYSECIKLYEEFVIPKYIGFNIQAYSIIDYQLKSAHVKFVRDAILAKQGGNCPICLKEVKLPTLDHYHKKRQDGTGLVRGVICNTCNRIIGCIENNLPRNSINYSDAPNVLRSIAEYLQYSRYNLIHPTEKKKEKSLKKSSYNKLKKIIGDKQKVPPYSLKLNAALKKLYEKYKLTPELR